MAAYPGGTAWDPTTRGHDFWFNYLCDLERAVALDGRPNGPASAFARGAMLVLALGMLEFWRLLAARVAQRPRVSALVRWLGAIASAGAGAAAVFPGDRYAGLHPIIMLAAGVPGVGAAALGSAALFATRSDARLDDEGAATATTTPYAIGAGIGVAAASLADLVLYAAHVVAGEEPPREVAVLERVALLLLLVWMALVAGPVSRRRPRRAAGADDADRSEPARARWSPSPPPPGSSCV
jgi:hypothetical protein